MGDDLGFLAQLVKERSEHLRRSLQRKTGRGSTLVAALEPVCAALEGLASAAVATPPTSSRQEGSSESSMGGPVSVGPRSVGGEQDA